MTHDCPDGYCRTGETYENNRRTTVSVSLLRIKLGAELQLGACFPRAGSPPANFALGSRGGVGTLLGVGTIDIYRVVQYVYASEGARGGSKLGAERSTRSTISAKS